MKRILVLLSLGWSSHAIDNHYSRQAHLRRQLNLLDEFLDPKSEESKPEALPPPHMITIDNVPTGESSVEELTKETPAEEPLSILALGGSVTWGATLEDRMVAYPWKVGQALGPNTHVDNLAMRATGADFPSLCIESLIEEAGSRDRSYDLILMDFVQNGTNGFPLLLKRLRQRFPNAVIVYVKLFSVKSNAMEEGTGKMMADLGDNPDINWIWRKGDVFNRGWQGTQGCGREICDAAQIEALVRDAGGYVYDFPRPASPKTCITEKWFADDWHHLSARGHEILSIDLMRYFGLVGKLDLINRRPKTLGTWNGGDQCYNWFMSGNIPLHYEGAEKKDLLQSMPDDEKWVLNVNSAGMSIEFDSKFNTPVPLGLGYMSRQDPPNYPKAQVVVNQDSNKSVVIDPRINRETGSTAHVTAFYHVGTAHPGHNVIQITPLPPQIDPFRVVGIYLCGVCTEFGHLGSGAVNYAGHDKLGAMAKPTT